MEKLVITNADVQNQVLKICRDILLSNWSPDYIVGLTRGGLIPSVMISHFLKVPLYTLGVSLRDAQGQGPETNCWMAEDAFGYAGDGVSDPTLRKNILIVDDINDTGATLNWIREDWQASCFPDSEAWESVWGSNVRFAVLVDNLSSKCHTCMDYHAVEVNKAEHDVWVGFSLGSLVAKITFIKEQA